MNIDIKNLPPEFIVPDGEQEFYSALGATLKTVRTNRNLSQQEIAEMLNVEAEYINAYERGELAIPVYHFLVLASKLNYPPEFDDFGKNFYQNH